MALTQIKRVLTLQDVKENFSDYNFIIFTNNGVIDTSNYTKVASEDTKTVSGITNSADYLLHLYNAEKTYPVTIGTSHATKTNCHKNIPEFKLVSILSSSVQRITIKSKRNFLGNQKPIQA